MRERSFHHFYFERFSIEKAEYGREEDPKGSK
jgi:hypothetical protein